MWAQVFPRLLFESSLQLDSFRKWLDVPCRLDWGRKVSWFGNALISNIILITTALTQAQPSSFNSLLVLPPILSPVSTYSSLSLTLFITADQARVLAGAYLSNLLLEECCMQSWSLGALTTYNVIMILFRITYGGKLYAMDKNQEQLYRTNVISQIEELKLHDRQSLTKTGILSDLVWARFPFTCFLKASKTIVGCCVTGKLFLWVYFITKVIIWLWVYVFLKALIPLQLICLYPFMEKTLYTSK